jgi:hypothetical protein
MLIKTKVYLRKSIKVKYRKYFIILFYTYQLFIFHLREVTTKK